jgi:tetratricopeptide (TPR) repeat protein
MIRLGLIRIIILSALITAILGISALGQTPQNWTSVRSKNFYLIGDASEAEIRGVAVRLEEFRQAFSELFPGLKLETPGMRTYVIVFKNDASYKGFKPKRSDGTADEPVAGYYQAGQDTNYITLSIPEAAADRYGTVFHEYAHSLVDANLGEDPLPAWLGEGIAEYFETLQVANGRVSLGGLRQDHLSLLRRSPPIPLSTLLETDHKKLHNGGDQSRSVFYAESWALVHRLINDRQRTDAEKIRTIRSIIDGSSNSEKSIREIFGHTDDEFEKTFVGAIERPSPAGLTFLLSGTASSDASVNTLSTAETNAYIGDLLYETGRGPEAVEYLRKAIALEPRQPLANGSLGLLLMRENKNTEAKPHLEIAAASPNASPFVIFNYAYSIMREAMDKDGAISEIGKDRRQKVDGILRRAISLKPGSAESYRLLAFIRMVDGEDLDEASVLAKKAIELAPANEDNTLLLAQIYLKQEKYREAYDVADRLAVLTIDPRIREDAREIVRDVNEYFASHAEAQKSEAFAVVGSLPPLILKRSAVSDAEIAKFDEDRVVNNLNRMLPRPKAGEKQIVAYIERVQCADDSINFIINASGQRSVFTSSNFADIRLNVITDGDRTFRLDCGVGFGKQLTVLTFRPPTGAASAKVRPQLVSITFVPDIFRMKTPEEMAKARLVVVEDDTFRKSGNHRTPTTVVDH